MSVVSFAGRSCKWNNNDDIKELIEEINKHDDLVELDLSGNILNNNTALLLSESLKNKPRLKKLHLNDLFTGRGIDIIRDSLECIFEALNVSGAKLQLINLSDNALGHRGITLISKILNTFCCDELEHLIMNNNGLGIHGAKIFCFLFNEWIDKLQSQKSECRLHSVELGRNRLEDEGTKLVCSPLKRITSLQNFQIFQNGIRSQGMAHLTEVLESNFNLMHLNLNDNLFVEEGSEMLAAILPNLKALKILDIGDCLIRDHGAKLIFKSLEMHSLTKLDIGFNELSGKLGVEALNLVKKMSEFETLILDGNQFGETWIEKMNQMFKQREYSSFAMTIEEDEGLSDVSDEDELIEAFEKTTLT